MAVIRVLNVDDKLDPNQLGMTMSKIDPEIKILLVKSAEDAIRMLEEDNFDCIVSEYIIPGMNGVDLCREVKKRKNVPFLIYTSDTNDNIVKTALRAGVDDYINKIVDSDLDVLAKRIRVNTENYTNKIDEQKKRKHFELNEKILDESIDSIILISEQGEIIYANKAAAKLRGYNVEELVGMNINELVGPDDQSKVDSTIKKIRNNRELKYESVNLSKAGEKIYLELKSLPIVYDGEKYIISLGRDISERKEYERKLGLLHQHANKLQRPETVEEIAEATLNIVMESLGYAIGAFGVVEEGFLNFIKISDLDRWRPFKLPLDGPGISVRCVKTGKSQFVADTREDPEYVIGPNKTSPQLSEIDVPVLVDDEVKAVIHVSSFNTNKFTTNDLSLLEIFADHVSLSMYRIIQKDRLKKITDAQSKKILEGATRVTSMVRHDLRSPMQSIRNATYVIRNSPDRTERMLEIIDSSVAYATKILEDLRFMAEPGAPNKEDIDLSKLLRERLSSAVIPSKIHVEIDVPSSLKLKMDPTMMSRAMDNLIRNAVEAMPDGGSLTVKAYVENGILNLSVKDTGVGIPVEVLDRLFEPFHTTKKTGTGLGLYYAKQAVDAHNGLIKVKSKELEGTEFSLTIPIN